MPDILADYREWRQQQEARVSTHSDGCHMWHKDCMIHRLAAALAVEMAKRTPSEPSTPGEGTRQSEGTSEPVAWRAYDTDGSEAVYSLYEQARAAADEWNWSVEPLYRKPTLTDAEREAIKAGIANCEDITYGGATDQEAAATLRGLLERTK
jgi:hypothetical protein